ncbi:MAG: hypothetical protein IT435_14605 [Phycisphaerales bacterium]|nr:hypothetical protein [Phycisphaerales bacterium]
MTRSLRTLLIDIIDYAGLFPPAALGMDDAVETYARARAGEHEWMLGRFICPVGKLADFSRAGAALMPGTFATSGYRERVDASEPWGISVLMDAQDMDKLLADLPVIDEFNQRHSVETAGLARIDMAEIKISDAQQIDAVLDELPEDIFPFFEFPVTTDCRGFVTALAGNSAGAKIRTGGVVGNAFPTADEIAAFLHACAAVDVPFKATAGLHHPLRGVHKLTYQPDSASCKMHGFLNLLVAAALVRAIKPDENLTRMILQEEDMDNFRFSEEILGWKEYLASVTDVALARESFALSFGSCAFDEPIEDLKRLKLL